jgi:hypothetical protein
MERDGAVAALAPARVWRRVRRRTEEEVDGREAWDFRVRREGGVSGSGSAAAPPAPGPGVPGTLEAAEAAAEAPKASSREAPAVLGAAGEADVDWACAVEEGDASGVCGIRTAEAPGFSGVLGRGDASVRADDGPGEGAGEWNSEDEGVGGAGDGVNAGLGCTAPPPDSERRRSALRAAAVCERVAAEGGGEGVGTCVGGEPDTAVAEARAGEEEWDSGEAAVGWSGRRGAGTGEGVCLTGVVVAGCGGDVSTALRRVGGRGGGEAIVLTGGVG